MTSSDLECKKWEDLDECKDDFVFPTDNGTLPDDEFFDKARGSDRLGAIGAGHDCHAPAALRRLSRSHGLRRRSAEPTRSSTGWAFAQSSPSLPPSQLLASSPRAGWLTRQRGRRGRRYRSAWRGSSSSLPLAPSRPTACHVRASERLTARHDVQSGWRPGGRYTSPSCQPRPTLQPLRAAGGSYSVYARKDIDMVPGPGMDCSICVWVRASASPAHSQAAPLQFVAMNRCS